MKDSPTSPTRFPLDRSSLPFSWLWLMLLWSLPVLPTAISLWLTTPTYETTKQISVSQLLSTNLFSLLMWWVWIPLTPKIVQMTRLFPLFGERSSLGRNLAIHCVSSLLVALLVQAYHYALHILFYGNESLAGLLLRLLQNWRGSTSILLVAETWGLMGIYALIVISAHLWLAYEESRERKLQLTEARMATLKAQIHPHFLFNTLNSVAALMEDDVPAARKTIARLSDLLRAALAEPPGEEVTLSEELKLIRHYLEIEQVRFGDRLKIEFDLSPQTSDAAVPHLLLQPLVENAVRHGIGGSSDAGLIKISAERQEQTLRIRVEDDGPGPDRVVQSVGSARTAKPAIGLANARARLEQLYGDRATIELEPGPDGGCICQVNLPWHRLTPNR